MLEFAVDVCLVRRFGDRKPCRLYLAKNPDGGFIVAAGKLVWHKHVMSDHPETNTFGHF